MDCDDSIQWGVKKGKRSRRTANLRLNNPTCSTTEMLQLQLARAVLCTRGFATRVTPRRDPSSSISPSSIYLIEKMLKVGLDEPKIKDLYEKMSLPVFMQNVTIAVLNNREKNSPTLEKLLSFTIDKLDKIAKVKSSYTHEPLHYRDQAGLEPSENVLYLILQLSLHINASSIAFTVLMNIINKCLYNDETTLTAKTRSLIQKFLVPNNLSLLIDLYSINRSQDRNITELNNILTLISRFNLLMDKFQFEEQKFQLSDSQMKSLIDKASYSLMSSTTTSLRKPYTTVQKQASPYSTIEMLIRDFGLIISKRVSYSISYYKEQVEEKEDEEEEETCSNIQELLDRQLLSKYLQFSYLVIQDRCKNNDPVTVYTIWTIIKPFHNKLYNATIDSENNNLSNNFYFYQTLAKMITLFSKNRRYRKLISEIIFDLPLDSVKICPELMSSILYHCGRTKNESLGAIVGSRYDDGNNTGNSGEESVNLKNLFGQGGDLSILGTGEKFTPGQVHAFLSYNLRLGNKKRALEIVEYLKYKLIGFTAIDFNELVRSILYTNKTEIKDSHAEKSAEVAWSMIASNHAASKGSLNKYALITYLDYMINTMNRKENKGKLNMVRVQEIFGIAYLEQPPSDVKYWNHFYMCYFKYLIRRFPLKIAKIVYENNKGPFLNGKKYMLFQKLGDYSFSNNPFTTRYADVRFRMDNNLKAMVLRDMYQRSDGYMKRAKQLESADIEEAKAQYMEISQWVYSELMAMSDSKSKPNKTIVHNSIILDLAKTIDRKSRELGFDLSRDATAKMPDAERKYRTQKGEHVAIGGIPVDDDYAKSLQATQSGWQNFFSKKSSQ